MLRAEEFFGAVDCQLLDDVDTLATAVITLGWVAFGVFVCECRTHCLHHCGNDEVFRCDKLDMRLLAFRFVVDCLENGVVDVFEGGCLNTFVHNKNGLFMFALRFEKLRKRL